MDGTLPSTRQTARWPRAGRPEPKARTGGPGRKLAAWCEEGTRGKRGALGGGCRTSQRTQDSGAGAIAGPEGSSAQGDGSPVQGPGKGVLCGAPRPGALTPRVLCGAPRPGALTPRVLREAPRPGALTPRGPSGPQARRLLSRGGKDGSHPGQKREPCQQGGCPSHTPEGAARSQGSDQSAARGPCPPSCLRGHRPWVASHTRSVG